MSPYRLVWAVQCDRFPRVSGDEPATVKRWMDEREFSPRERG